MKKSILFVVTLVTLTFGSAGFKSTVTERTAKDSVTVRVTRVSADTLLDSKNELGPTGANRVLTATKSSCASSSVRWHAILSNAAHDAFLTAGLAPRTLAGLIICITTAGSVLPGCQRFVREWCPVPFVFPAQNEHIGGSQLRLRRLRSGLIPTVLAPVLD